ncbi:MAG: thiol-activated cytolysin family protein [Bacteroidota bacterium]
MKLQEKLKTLTVALFVSVLFFSCEENGGGGDTPGPNTESIADLVASSGLPGSSSSLDVSRDTANPDFDIPNNWVCETIEVDAVGAVGDYRTYDPNSDVVWPGNLLQGASLTQATPEVIDVKRSGGTFTINLINGSSSTQFSVDEVNQANVIEGINDIIAQNNGVLPANFTYDQKEVRSTEELALAMQVDAETLTNDFNAKISADSRTEYNSILVDFVQKYYTIVYISPNSEAEVFDEAVGVNDLQPFMGNNNPPVYIKSVTYGRRYYLMITSKASATKMKASISNSYDAALANGSLEADATYVGDLEEVSIRVFAMGGDAQQAAATFSGDFNAVKQFLTEGGSINTGVPLSYKMESLALPHVDVGIGINSRFSVPYCQSVYSSAPPTYTHAWFGIFDNEGIGFATGVDQDLSNSILFNQSGTQYAEIRNNQVQGIYDLGASSDQGPLAGSPFTSAGAAQIWQDQIMLFSADGLQYALQRDNGSWSNVRNLNIWGPDGEHPFLQANAGGDAGVGAAYFSSQTAITILGNRQETTVCYQFNKAGNRYVLYSVRESSGSTIAFYGDVKTLDELADGNFPFPQVGAALRLSTNDDPLDFSTFLFNKAGTSFTILKNGNFSEAYNIVTN